MEIFAAYGHAIAALAIFALIAMVLSPVSALSKQKDGIVPGGTPPQDYSNRSYRLHRAQQNAVEALPVFATATIAAILAGVSPHWVNWLASLVVVARVVMLYFHVTGRGKPDVGARSFSYVAGLLCYFLLALMALVKVF